MFFLISRVAENAFAPGTVLVLLLASGTILTSTRYRRLGLRLVWIVSACFAFILLFPVDHWLIKPLEDRFPRPSPPPYVDGIIVLSGGSLPGVLATRGVPPPMLATARYIAAAEALRHYPSARLVFSGGSGSLIDRGDEEADVARMVFNQLGVDESRVTYEDRSRNTWENLLFSKNLANPNVGETWLLVTSAIHMPRAVGVARSLGWDVIPWPSDYFTGADEGMLATGLYFTNRLPLLEAAIHEWLGLAVYRATGRSDALFPSNISPRNSPTASSGDGAPFSAYRPIRHVSDSLRLALQRGAC